VEKEFSVVSVITVVFVIILLSVSLLYVDFAYPAGGSGNGHRQVFDLFLKQYYDKNGLGYNRTVFKPTVKSVVYLVGYTRGGGNALLKNSKLFAAVYPEETDTLTNATGFYSISVLYRGTGTFAFKMQNFSTVIQNVTLNTRVNWLNLTFAPSALYNVSGSVTSTSGIAVIHASVSFNDFFSNTTFFSNSSGNFVATLPNGAYNVTATAPFYGAALKNVTVNGTQIFNFNIVLPNVTNRTAFTVTGIVQTTSGLPVSGADVKCSPFNNVTATNSKGFFTLKGIFGYITLTTRASAYVTNLTTPLLVRYNIPLVVVTVQPVASIGTNINLLNMSSWNSSYIAFYNSSALMKKIGTPQPSGSFSQNGSTISIRLLNSTGGISNDGYLLYVIANGVIYSGTSYYSQITNSTGFMSLHLNYQGNFTIVVKSPYYHSYIYNGTFTGAAFLNASLRPVRLFTVIVNGTDPYNSSAALNNPFAVNLRVRCPLTVNSTKMLNFTRFTFLLPNGTYIFSPNAHSFIGNELQWVNEEVILQLNGKTLWAWLHYRQYMTMIHDNSRYRIFSEISLSDGYYGATVRGNTSPYSWLNLSAINGFAQGNYSYLISFGNGTYNVTGTFILNSVHPIFVINFSVNSTTMNITTSSTSCVIDGTSMSMNFNIKASGGTSAQLLANMDLAGLNFTLNNSYFYVSSNTYNFSGNWLNLTTFTLLKGTTPAALDFTNLTRQQESDLLTNLTILFYLAQPLFRFSYIYL
jgi:hypothetical protein